MSSTWLRVSIRRSSSKYDQSAYALRAMTRPALGERVEHRPQVELQAVQVVPRSDREVLVVQEQGDAFFFGIHEASLPASGPAPSTPGPGPA